MNPSQNSFKEDFFYIEKINQLRKERNAVILAHNYQRPEVQDIADFVGDSLGLSIEAAKTGADIIVFCGVHFMAETAAILSPRKTVLMPDYRAGCPMADMITAAELKQKKQLVPDAIVVCYVNSSAEVKAESDICCTSSNAVQVVESLPAGKPILFVPDEHLGRYTAVKTKREIIFWPGYCPTHHRVNVVDLLEIRKIHPNASCIVHPECNLEVIEAADAAFSTGGIVKYAAASEAKEIIIGTECGLLHRLEKSHPNKKFILASKKLICPNMKLTTLDKISQALELMKYQINVPDTITRRAKQALDKMIEIIP